MVLFINKQKILRLLLLLLCSVTLASCGKNFLNPKEEPVISSGSDSTSLHVNYANGLSTGYIREDCKQTMNSNNCLIFTERDNDPIKLIDKPFNSGNIALELKDGPVAFIVPKQKHVVVALSSTALYYDESDAFQNSYSDIQVHLFNKESGKMIQVILSGQRYLRYGFNSSISNYVTFYDTRVGTLYVSFHKEKNPRLKSGSYEGEFTVQAKSPLSEYADFSKDILVKVFITLN